MPKFEISWTDAAGNTVQAFMRTEDGAKELASEMSWGRPVIMTFDDGITRATWTYYDGDQIDYTSEPVRHDLGHGWSAMWTGHGDMMIQGAGEAFNLPPSSVDILRKADQVQYDACYKSTDPGGGFQGES